MSYDLNILAENCDGDPTLMRRVVAIFLAECEGQLAVLRDAHLRRDAERLFSMAHSIKGSVSNFGARQARDAAVAIETGCRAGRLDEIGPQIDELERSVLSLAESLRCATM